MRNIANEKCYYNPQQDSLNRASHAGPSLGEHA